MRRPLVDRRDFLKAAGLGFAASLAPRGLAIAAASDAVFATAYQTRGGGYGVAVLSEDGRLIHAVDLPDRGHDVTFDPVSRRSVVFARQPGTFALVFDPAGGRDPTTITSVPGRHFYGHGAFSPDGKILYATENDYEAAAGMVGIYDASDAFRRIGEIPTYGVGPHEMLLMPDGRTLAIANGGIETHPDYGRAELNIATMKPSLTLVDRETGTLVVRHELSADLHQLSIRHMDLDAAGSLWFGCQHRGPASERPALVGRVQPGADLELVDLPERTRDAFRNYVGSVAANRQAGTVAFSSPQGNIFAVLDAKSGTLISQHDLVEVCGLAPYGTAHIASTGTGVLVRPGAPEIDLPNYAWDNHMLRIAG